MKRLTLLLLTFCLFNTFLYSQTSEEYYKATSLEALFIDSLTNNIVATRPWGESVVIQYKVFFKDYQVIYYDKNGAVAYMNFDYLVDLKNDEKLYVDRHSGTRYICSNIISASGERVLSFSRTPCLNGTQVIFLIRNMVKTQL